MELTIKTPFIRFANDYHEFDKFQDAIKELTGKIIHFEEFETEIFPEDQCYAAVFYMREETERALAMIEEHANTLTE